MYVYSFGYENFKRLGFSSSLFDAINRRDFGIACEMMKNHVPYREWSKKSHFEKELAKVFFDEILRKTYSYEIQMSSTMVEVLKELEGLEEYLYNDRKPDDPKVCATIGCGHMVYRGAVGSNVAFEIAKGYREDGALVSITDDEIKKILKEDLREAVDCLDRNTKIKLTQNEMDALISFIFNSGCDGFCNIERSGVDNALCNGNYHQAIQRMQSYNSNGLLENRRNSEINVFNNDVYKFNP